MGKSLSSYFLSGLLLLAGSGLWGQQDATQNQVPDRSTSAAPDNTGKNRRDKSAAEPSADNQKENNSDRELTRQIRRAIVQDKSLSTYAHNVKIVAQNGMVTLKGPVKSQEEKQAIESKAAEIAGGQDKVTSELEVASK